jgi:archaellum component FlaC
MDDRKLTIFNAIASFVQDLDVVFEKKHKPVALYNRLVSKTTIKDIEAIDRHIEAFTQFFNHNKDFIDTQKIQLDSKVVYSERVYLDIGNILEHKSDNDTKKAINQHLITIYSLINAGTKAANKAIASLKKNTSAPVDNKIKLPNTTEGKFIEDALTEMTAQLDTMDDTSNPMAMVTTMMQSGFFSKFMGDLQSKFSNGEMNLKSLMTTVTTVVSDVVPADSEEGAQIKTFMDQSLSQVSAMTGGEGVPEELQEHLDKSIQEKLNTF